MRMAVFQLCGARSCACVCTCLLSAYFSDNALGWTRRSGESSHRAGASRGMGRVGARAPTGPFGALLGDSRAEALIKVLNQTAFQTPVDPADMVRFQGSGGPGGP